MKWLIPVWVALAVVAVVAVAKLADAGPFAPSFEERVSEKLGAKAKCEKAGLANVAGERETVYLCSYPADKGPPRESCLAEADGDVYVVTLLPINGEC